MERVLVLGAGKIGVTVAELLADCGDYEVVLADHRPDALLGRAPAGIGRQMVDAKDPAALAAALAGIEVVVSALPFFLDVAVAEAALAAGAHYFDLTEDIHTARRIRALAEGAGTVLVPQCGLAPGFIAIVANALAGTFDQVYDVRLRVGALPQFPDNALKYNLTWSTDGLINEYCNTCEAIHEGRPLEVLPLEGLEEFSLDGMDYEAFHTSGGVGTLCETLAGRVRNLTYKTIRYPGHRQLVQMLARDLRLCERREVFRDVIEQAVPVTRQDVVLVFVTVTGRRAGLLTQETWARKVYGDAQPGGHSAIQKTTAAGVCAMIDLHRTGKLPATGFVRQEQAGLADVLGNRFGRVFG